jgi:hypothetical protein
MYLRCLLLTIPSEVAQDLRISNLGRFCSVHYLGSGFGRVFSQNVLKGKKHRNCRVGTHLHHKAETEYAPKQH